jgi:hypothetical protein
MAAYTILSENRKTFNIKSGDEVVASLNYTSWFQIDADLIVGDKKYLIRQKGFWGLTVEVLDGDASLYSFAMNWKGQIIINAMDTQIERDFVFKHKMSLKQQYTLSDKNGVELLEIDAKFKLASLKFEYDIATSDAFEALGDKLVLIGIQLHCVNYYISMMSAAV